MDLTHVTAQQNGPAPNVRQVGIIQHCLIQINEFIMFL